MENSILNYSKYQWNISRNEGIPFQYEDEKVKIFINGVIFNAEKLSYKRTGNKKGYFESLSYLWSIKRYDILKDLNGNYALFIYEKGKEILHVITDILGTVPIYYKKDSNIIEFSFYPIEGILEMSYLPTLMFTRFIPSPSTLWKKVYKVPPATVLSFCKNRIEISDYRSSFYTINCRDDRFIEKEIKNILSDNIKNYGDLDKIGIGISGGVDSALIAAVGKQYFDFTPLSVIFKGSDDIKYIEKVFEDLNLKGEIIEIDKIRFWEIWKEILKLPKLFVSPSISLLYELYENFNAKGIKYVISGHGADELFGGYPRYVWEKSLFFLSPLKYILKLPNFLKVPLTHRIRINLEALATYNPEKRIYAWMAGMTEDHIREMFYNGRVNWILLSTANVYHDKLANMMYHDISGLLPDMLIENDYIASSLFGVKVLYPFASPDMVKLSLTMPSSQRVNNMVTKYFLRRTASKYVSRCISLRRQKGIKVPLKDWIKEEPIKNDIMDMMKDVDHILGKVIKIDSYKRMVNDHMNGWHDYSREIFMIYNLYHYIKRRKYL